MRGGRGSGEYEEEDGGEEEFIGCLEFDGFVGIWLRKGRGSRRRIRRRNGER